LTLRGTPTLYYGDEIGMRQVAIPADRVRDPWERNVPGQGLGRDGCRTPMQWDATLHAGFSQVEPWLPLHDDFRRDNVASERSDPASIYRLYQKLIQMRRQFKALAIGRYCPVAASDNVLAYERVHGSQAFLVALNLGSAHAMLERTGASRPARIVLSTFADRESEAVGKTLVLRADEGVVVELLRDHIEC
jgi:alpha-glucosidase